MNRIPRPRPRVVAACFCCILVCWAVAGRASALEPDQVALVVNSKVPAGMKLAEFYASQRHIPAGRIISLDMPVGDDISYDDYNLRVVPAVRNYLAEHGLEQKVTCLVTFWGVPLRIGNRTATPAENEEIQADDAEIHRQTERARQAVREMEALAKELDPSFAPAGTDGEMSGLTGRAEAAVNAVVKALAREPDAARRAAQFTRLLGPLETLAGAPSLTVRLGQPPLSTLAAQPPTSEQITAARANGKRVVDEINGLTSTRLDDPAARARIRELARESLGAFGDLGILTELKARLNPAETQAAFDSELALVWWKQDYVRSRWQRNPLYFKVKYQDRLTTRPAADGAPLPPAPATQAESRQTLMVTRIDAPTEQLARDLITTSIRVEQEGLKGVAALDARGKRPPDAYGRYDQTIRDLAALLKRKTTMPVVLDDAEPVFAKGSVKDVAIYCGWYSLRNYVPGMRFNPGAVGYHIASSELVALHNPAERGWVHGLMTDGVVGTLGPVAEPYLHSFPAADEFFPLLLTGKLTLGEVYWLSNPVASWMNTCIGDPLYRPYAKNAPLAVEDLPRRLHVVFE